MAFANSFVDFKKLSLKEKCYFIAESSQIRIEDQLILSYGRTCLELLKEKLLLIPKENQKICQDILNAYDSDLMKKPEFFHEVQRNYYQIRKIANSQLLENKAVIEKSFAYFAELFLGKSSYIYHLVDNAIVFCGEDSLIANHIKLLFDQYFDFVVFIEFALGDTKRTLVKNYLKMSNDDKNKMMEYVDVILNMEQPPENRVFLIMDYVNNL